MDKHAEARTVELQRTSTKSQLMLTGAALLSILMATAVMTENSHSAIQFENWSGIGTIHIGES